MFEERRAECEIFDSITLFEILFNGESECRLLVYELIHTIEHSGATFVITAETDKIYSALITIRTDRVYGRWRDILELSPGRQ